MHKKAGTTLLLIINLIISLAGLWSEERFLDFKSVDFSSEIVDLEGDWDFYWSQLLSPDSAIPADNVPMAVPGEWDLTGDFPPRGYATYRLRVLLPESSEQLALYIPFTTNQYRIFINNRLWAEHGDVNTEMISRGSRIAPLVLTIPDREVLDIVYQISNFDDINGGILEVPQIGSFSNLNKERNRGKIFEAFLFGALFITGMLYLSFYVNKKDDNSSLYFGLFSLVLALRTLLYGEHILLQTMTNLPLELEFALGHLTFYFALPLFLKFITTAYPLTMLKKINIPVYIISALFSLLVIFTHHGFYIQFLVVYQLVTVIAGLFIIFCLTRTALKGNDSAKVTIVGFIVLLFTAINDIFYSQEIIHTFHMVPIGVAVFIMSQAALLSWNIGKAFSKSEELALELITANDSFRRFVPEEFLKYLKKDRIADIKLGDHVELDMTVLFCDIRDFTSLSENMTPHENFNFLNSFLERIGPVIRKYDGFVDKYIGDGVMALFPGEADSAVLAALKIEESLNLYNQHRDNSGYDPIRIGIGLNTGSLMLGTIGENERMDSTVISDAVNVCSRIESITKEYGLSIALSENTYSKLTIKDDLETRNIGRVILKGKKEPVSVYELYNGDDPHIIKRKNSMKIHFEEAVRLFENKDYENSLSKFSKILEAFPEDDTCRKYQAKIFQYLTNLVD